MARKRPGFTLIELLVVIAIIAILAAILFPVFAKARESARGSACKSNLQQIGKAMMMYTQEFDEKYPQAEQTQGGFVPSAAHLPGEGGLHGNNVACYRCLIAPFIKSKGVFDCPSSGSRRFRYGFHYRLPTVTNPGAEWRTHWYNTPNAMSEADAKTPANMIVITDHMHASNAGSEPDPLKWIDNAGGANSYVRFPIRNSYNYPYYNSDPWRPAARHNDACNALYLDGHVKSVRLDQVVGKGNTGNTTVPDLTPQCQWDNHE